ncbi:hypothetical protein, partial [Staphylococcus aureus]|uniref:hypothetical protein n=1 Tax=Staphylococcus aureus TaxID=1280 RepID=UPI001C82D2E2
TALDDAVLDSNDAHTEQMTQLMSDPRRKTRRKNFLSVILSRVNEIFITDKLTDKDMINYVHTVADKMSENVRMMKQIQNNTREQAMLGEFDTALDDAVLDSNDAHTEQMTQLMSDPRRKTRRK